MRRSFLVLLGALSFAVSGVTPARQEHESSNAPTTSGETSALRAVAGWLKAEGAEGFLATEVADVIGIPHEAGAELLAAWQRGYRDAGVLRIAQFVDEQYVLFMVQAPGEVKFYLSTLHGGLRKALVSLPGPVVNTLDAAEAAANFRRELLYWQDKAAR